MVWSAHGAPSPPPPPHSLWPPTRGCGGLRLNTLAIVVKSNPGGGCVAGQYQITARSVFGIQPVRAGTTHISPPHPSQPADTFSPFIKSLKVPLSLAPTICISPIARPPRLLPTHPHIIAGCNGRVVNVLHCIREKHCGQGGQVNLHGLPWHSFGQSYVM
jgi:hypothetical protein